VGILIGGLWRGGTEPRAWEIGDATGGSSGSPLARVSSCPIPPESFRSRTGLKNALGLGTGEISLEDVVESFIGILRSALARSRQGVERQGTTVHR